MGLQLPAAAGDRGHQQVGERTVGCFSRTDSTVSLCRVACVDLGGEEVVRRVQGGRVDGWARGVRSGGVSEERGRVCVRVVGR